MERLQERQVSYCQKTVGESEIEITTEQVNQIIVRVTPVEWELSTFAKC